MDIEGLELDPALRELVGRVRADDPNIAGIRVGQNAPGVVRLVIDLKRAASPQVFTLQPVAAWEKGALAQPNMRFDRDRLEARYTAHIYDSKEAASGAGSVGGGGCGCN